MAAWEWLDSIRARIIAKKGSKLEECIVVIGEDSISLTNPELYDLENITETGFYGSKLQKILVMMKTVNDDPYRWRGVFKNYEQADIFGQTLSGSLLMRTICLIKIDGHNAYYSS